MEIYGEKRDYIEHIVLKYEDINNINGSYIYLLCTANKIYVNPFDFEGIKINEYLSAYILPSNIKYCSETTIIVTAGNVVTFSGIIKNGSIIWKRQLHLNSLYMAELESFNYIQKFEDKIISSIVLNNISIT